MNHFDHELTRRLASIHTEGLSRQLRRIDSPQSPRITINGETLLNFSSNDYLGLANDPALKQAAIEATERYGTGTGASRLICGSLAPHHQLEDALAAFKVTPAALSFSTGYAAALGTISTLLDKDDILIVDKLVHACIVDAARLCGAKLRVFAHNDLDELEGLLQWADKCRRTAQSPIRNQRSQILIVTESVFSMDGDYAPLGEIVELKDKYGAWLMVDEAHATGLYGKNRRGRSEELGVGDRVEVQMGTLGKALGASGGYICGSRALVDYLVNRARTFIFSTATGPAAAAAATAGIRFVESNAGEERLRQLWQRVSELASILDHQPSTSQSAIMPIMIGDETKAMAASSALRARGIFLPAIRYPSVARGQARLRLTVTAAHTSRDLLALTDTLSLTLDGSRVPQTATSP
jgi:8-amino-7-oxononanoate synthase